MRIALLSDIHGNLFALEAVLKRLAQEKIDQIICLGDVAMFGPQILLNPGSVGLPYETLPDSMDRNPPWAEFAIIEWSSGELTVTLRRVHYDIAPLLAAARASGMPHAEWWVKDWR